MPQDAQDLKVWQRAIDLTVCIYQLTKHFPKEETYGLVSQLRRASVSVASNIAEGRGRLNAAEFRQFLGIALGSTFEVKTQLIVARRLDMGSSAAIDEAAALGEEVSKMLTSFIQKLSSKATSKLRAES
ncbi:four helix bundle protein [Occallatibacter savannae]|uniref:four helix bundle protein n=1 Tax=Occallatibacter savannae TaxID=1002691 RepID=UPI000D68B694|nr:four helix bundle protein [Occallatibacter savannae]